MKAATRLQCNLVADFAEGRGSVCVFGDEAEFAQLGVNLFVLAPGDPIGMYHWEADQEDFLVLSGEATLIVEGEERPLAGRALTRKRPIQCRPTPGSRGASQRGTRALASRRLVVGPGPVWAFRPIEILVAAL